MASASARISCSLASRSAKDECKNIEDDGLVGTTLECKHPEQSAI